MSFLVHVTASIANGESLSGAINLNGNALIGVSMPAEWTAADITFQASSDGSTYRNLYDSAGNEVSIKADASRHIRLAPDDFSGFKFLKVRSGTASTPVNQGAARTLTLVTEDL